MKKDFFKNKVSDSRINYRGKNASRLDNLTDAVFGIAITLLIFNLVNPNSFNDLITFTKTLPAFLISVSFVILIWNEHTKFSQIYSLNDSKIIVLNTAFIALVIFYVYPLRFLTLFLTNFFFNTNIDVNIDREQVPYLMIYYGFAAFALYFVLYLFYLRVSKISNTLHLNSFEIFYTKAQKRRMIIMMFVPLLSILVTVLVNLISFAWASFLGGFIYFLYTPLMIKWHNKFKNEASEFK